MGNSRICIGQLTATTYENFSQTILNSYLINPASTDSSYSFKVRLNSINELGLLKNVRKFYLDSDIKVSANTPNAYHFIGIQAFNTKLGDYISQGRLQGRYAWFAPLSKKSAMSAGVSLGFVNFSFETTQGGSGGSDSGPEGSVGLHYIRAEGLTVGIAMQQIFTPVITPVIESFKLYRLYNVDITQKIKFSSQLDISLFSVIQLSDIGYYTYTMGLLSTIADMGLIGINNYYLRKTTVNLGLQKINLYDFHFSVIASYSVYHSQISLPDNMLEFFIAIQK